MMPFIKTIFHQSSSFLFPKMPNLFVKTIAVVHGPVQITTTRPFLTISLAIQTPSMKFFLLETAF